MNRLLLAACLCLSMLAIGALGQESNGPLTNAAVVRLVKAGFKEKTIITIINNRPADFKLGTEQLIELKRSGVNENIILAMLSSQMGTVFVEEDEWSGESLFKDSKKRQAAKASGASSARDRARNRLVVQTACLVVIKNEGNVSGSATVRIIKPRTEAGDKCITQARENTDAYKRRRHQIGRGRIFGRNNHQAYRRLARGFRPLTRQARRALQATSH